MKIVILGDTHFGLRDTLPVDVFAHHYKKFYKLFFQYLLENDIKLIIQLGDLFDKRKSINTNTLNFAKTIFFDELQKYNIQMYTLLGNHDIHFRESLRINTPSEVLQEYTNITIFDKPTTITLDKIKVDMIPWLCKENEVECLDYIKNSNSTLCFGHFEIKDYPMYKNIETTTGLSRDILKNYELVISGHYHTYSNRDNIMYTGVPYQMTWHDHNDTKGFYVYCTENNKIDLIENPHTSFYKFDIDNDLPDISNLDLENCFVKLNIINNVPENEYNKFRKELDAKLCYEVKASDNVLNIDSKHTDMQTINIEDTISVINSYIDNSNISIDKRDIKEFMNNLYLDSLMIGESE